MRRNNKRYLNHAVVILSSNSFQRRRATAALGANRAGNRGRERKGSLAASFRT